MVETAQVIDVWEPVTESDVQTPLEVYKELQEDGYDVVREWGGGVQGGGEQVVWEGGRRG